MRHKEGFIPIRKAFLLKLLEKCTHEELDSIAVTMSQTKTEETVLKFESKYDLASTLRAIDDWLRLTDLPYSYNSNDGLHHFVILHDLGSKFSVYLAKLFATTINQFGVIPRYEYTDKVLSLQVDLSSQEDEKRRTDEQIQILDSVIKHIESRKKENQD